MSTDQTKRCWKCSSLVVDEKVFFRSTCDHCGAWLHVCKNCCHYKPGRRNDCEIPETELIADREACNFCEYFTVLGEPPKKGKSIEDVSKRLFG